MVTLDDQGQVVSASGLDKVWDSALKGDPSASRMKDALGDKMVAGMLSGSAEMLPTTPVAKGDSWQVKARQSTAMGNCELTGEAALKDIEKIPAGRIAVIDVKGKLTPSKAVDAAGPMGRVGKMDFGQTGTVKVNLDTGVVAASTMNLDGTMEAVGPGQGNSTQKAVRMKQTIEVTTTPGPYKASTTKPADSRKADGAK